MVVCGGSTGQGGGCSILGSTMTIQRKEWQSETSTGTQEHAAKMAARAQNFHLSVGLMSEIVALYTVSTDTYDNFRYNNKPSVAPPNPEEPSLRRKPSFQKKNIIFL